MKISKIGLGELDTNCYIVTDEQTGRNAIVDPDEYSPALARLFNAKRITKIDYILLTHGHFDHIGGVDKIKSIFNDAKIVIGAQDEEMLADGFKNGSFLFEGFEQKTQSAADILVNDGDELLLGEIKIKVMHTPGHTKGGVCYIAENSIFSGDTMFRFGCGRTDMYGGSGPQLMASLQALADLEGDYDVYPGHGAATTLKYEREHSPYLRRDI